MDTSFYALSLCDLRSFPCHGPESSVICASLLSGVSGSLLSAHSGHGACTLRVQSRRSLFDIKWSRYATAVTLEAFNKASAAVTVAADFRVFVA